MRVTATSSISMFGHFHTASILTIHVRVETNSSFPDPRYSICLTDRDILFHLIGLRCLHDKPREYPALSGPPESNSVPSSAPEYTLEEKGWMILRKVLKDRPLVPASKPTIFPGTPARFISFIVLAFPSFATQWFFFEVRLRKDKKSHVLDT